jgi:cytoskeletal protein CcmA (bactofilin family)
MAEIRIKEIDEHEIDTILAEDIDFEGHLTFKKPLMIKGKFKGEIKSPSFLYVGDKAYVEAKVESGLVSSRGRIKGDIVGHTRVELFSTAHVEGDITTPDLVAESGCKFNGYCNMGGITPKEAAPAPQARQGANAPVQGAAVQGGSAQAPQGGAQPHGNAPQPPQAQPRPAAPPQGGNTPMGGNRQ